MTFVRFAMLQYGSRSPIGSKCLVSQVSVNLSSRISSSGKTSARSHDGDCPNDFPNAPLRNGRTALSILSFWNLSYPEI